MILLSINKKSYFLRDLIIYKNCLYGVFVADVSSTFILSLSDVSPVSNNSRDLYIMIICKLFVRFQFEDRGYDRWDWGGYIVIHGQFSAQPRVGNVSRSLGRNTIIASNDSIETLIDDITWEQHLRFLKFAASKLIT